MLRAFVILSFLAVSVFSVPVTINLNETSQFKGFLEQLKGLGPVITDLGQKVSNSVGQGRYGEDAGVHDFEAIQWAEFQKKFQREYRDSDEMLSRFHIFKKNMATVKEMQNNQELGSATYSVLTPFGDMSEEEFRTTHRMPLKFFQNAPVLPSADIPPLRDAPASFDWRQKGAVTAVKNQQQCGSCWAFSTTGNVEGQWFLKKNKLVSLSEQELVDCDKVDQGCEGGLPSTAYKQIIKLGGLEKESAYPYAGADDSCEFKQKLAAVYINSSVAISQDEKEMAAWLAKNGPISIGINANMMQFYTGGVAHPWKIFCSPANLDHGVLIVGYGTDGSTPYWIVKNSWGPTWGEQGYYRVFRGAGVCGLNMMCTSAVVN